MEVLARLNGVKSNGHTPKPSLPPVPTAFNPEDVGPALSDFQRPVRVEGEIYNLEVEGEIPKEISGTFYRIMPDPAFPPFIKDDIVCVFHASHNQARTNVSLQWINGDGVVSAFRVQDGHVDFKQRYVETEKLKEERKVRRALAGKHSLRSTTRESI